MRRVVPLIYVCLLLATTVAPAFAQQRLFAKTGREVVELDPRPASLGTLIRRFPLPEEATAYRETEVVTLLGGELLAWVSSGDDLVVLNTRSGAVQVLNVPDFHPYVSIGTDGNARWLVLGWNASSLHRVLLVADAHLGSTRFLELGDVLYDVPAGDRSITYAAASDLLFVARVGVGADSHHAVDVIHVNTGALLKTLDISPVSRGALSTNAAGTRLYVTESNVLGTSTSAFDVVSGTRFASNPSGAFGVPDELRNRLISHRVVHANASPEFRRLRGIAAFSPESLQLLGRVQLPELPLPAETPDYGPFLTEHIDVSGLSATMFVLQGVGLSPEHYGGGSCFESQLIALEVDTGQMRQIVSTTDALGPGACPNDLVRITEPAPPTAPTADVAGHQVTLKWQAPFGATQYEMEAGSAPGRADRARVRVTDPQLVVDGVPSGVYYVRMRGINTIGKSGASREIQVIVP